MTARTWIIAALVIAASAMPAGAADVITGRAAVAGPGALTVEGAEIRLFDIHMPGPDAKCAEWRGQKQVPYACHLRARAFLESLVADDTVACVSESRAFAICYADGRDVGKALISAGWAENCGRTNRYVAAEEAAREAGRGLWAGQFSLTGQCRDARAGEQ